MAEEQQSEIQEEQAFSPDSSDSDAPPSHIFRQLLYFLYHYALWWLCPIVLILVVMGIVALLAGPARKPFIYQ